MTGRERIEAALSKDGASKIPVVICYERIFIRDHWAGLTGRAVWESGASSIPGPRRRSRFSVSQTRRRKSS